MDKLNGGADRRPDRTDDRLKHGAGRLAERRQRGPNTGPRASEPCHDLTRGRTNTGARVLRRRLDSFPQRGDFLDTTSEGDLDRGPQNGCRTLHITGHQGLANLTRDLRDETDEFPEPRLQPANHCAAHAAEVKQCRAGGGYCRDQQSDW